MLPISAQSGIYKAEYSSKLSILFKEYNGLNTLYFDQTSSLYIHNDWSKETTYFESTFGVIGFKLGDEEGMPVYKNTLQNKMVWKELYGKAPALDITLVDSIPHIDWEITDEGLTIEGIETIKAVGKYEGRIYNAWFAPSIPVPFGPYKLGGLPGLILSAISNDGKVFWKFKSLKSDIDENVLIAPPSTGRLMEWDEFEQFRFDWFQSEIQQGYKVFEIKKDELIEKERYLLYTKFKQKGYKTLKERKKLKEKKK